MQRLHKMSCDVSLYLQMLSCPEDEKPCNVCNVSENSEIQDLSLWKKIGAFEKQVIGVSHQIMQHVCP